MKTLKLFSAFALFSIFLISCSQKNNAGAVYFLENNLSEKLTITNSQLTPGTSVVTSKNVDLYLTSSSEFFNSHIQNLESIDITNVSYEINNTSIDLSSSIIKIGDMTVPSFNTNSGTSIQINDSDTLINIANALQQEGKVTFSFENSFSTNVDLEINVKIQLKGTFVH
jgi:hypothetical protein